MLGPMINMLKKLLLPLLASFICLILSPSPASANVTPISSDPLYASGPFQFFCLPYLRSFEDGKHYITTLPNPNCQFSIPSEISVDKRIGISIYKGVPGNAKLLSGELAPTNATLVMSGSSNLYETDSNDMPILPKQDDDFFSVVYAGSYNLNDFFSTDAPAFNNFFTQGTPPPSNNYKIIKWKWGSKPAAEFDPVIIIPGILGSWEKNGQWILDPILHTYDNLINTLLANGYVENQTLFRFPYDWEQSNVTTAQLLAQKISQIKTVCNCSKVDVVSHSMGGLVALQYIESGDYQDDVDQLFLLGTPLLGAPKAYKAWEAGEMDFDTIPTNVLLTRIFNREAADNGYSNIFDYIHQKPVSSVQELLPVYQNYLKLGSTLLQYPTGYPANPFLEQLADGDTYYQKVIKKVQQYVVTGDMGALSTVSGFTIKQSTQPSRWQDGEIVSPILDLGDGTVPFESSGYAAGEWKNFEGINHMGLASSSSAYVFSQLNNAAPITVIGKKYGSFFDPDWLVITNKFLPSKVEFKNFTQMIHDVFFDNLAGHTLLFITLFSPIDVQITAPDGKHLGKDFVTGANLNEIPNAIYSGPIGEHEYALILDPLPGQYKVDTIGTGVGAYTVAAGRIDQATTSTSFVSGTTSLNQIISNTLLLSSTSTTIALIPPPPIATSTPTTTLLTPDTCIKDTTAAYKAKWIGKKTVYEKLVFDCKALKELFKMRDRIEKEQEKRKRADNMLLAATYAGIRLTLADMDLWAKDKGNTKDAVLLIHKYTTWFRNHELHQ